MKYRPEVDGLRAVAVAIVLVYHAKFTVFGHDLLQGGYLGVDIFFVISGFLITHLILDELETSNKFHVVEFYERRARRLIPVLLFVIFISMIFAWKKMLPIDLVDFAKSTLSVIGFGSNFYFLFSTTQYGAEAAQLKPLLHTWSLSVEEQFYLLVPLYIMITRNFNSRLQYVMILTILILSFSFSIYMASRNSDLNFFLPFSRVWEILVGSVVAYYYKNNISDFNQSDRSRLCFTGISLIFLSLFIFNHNTLHPSHFTLLPVLGTALLLAFCSHNNGVGRLLSWGPIRGVGLISYSLYLWHFPVFAYSRLGSIEPSNVTKLKLIAISVVLAIMSYFLIEKPFRNKKLISRRQFYFVNILVLIPLVAMSFAIIMNDGYDDRLPKILRKNTSELKVRVWREKDEKGRICQNQSSNFCGVFNSANAQNIYLVGDSHLSAIAPKLREKLSDKYNLIEMNRSSCPFIIGTSLYNEAGVPFDSCNIEWQETRLKNIKKDGSIVILGGRYPVYLSGQYFDNREGGVEGGRWKYQLGEDFEDLELKFQKTLEVLVNNNIHTLLIYPIPEVGVNVPSYILSQRGNQDFKPLTTSFEVYLERSKRTFSLFEKISSPLVHSIYPHNIFCDPIGNKRCYTHDLENVFYADDDHLSGRGSELLVETILKVVDKITDTKERQ